MECYVTNGPELQNFICSNHPSNNSHAQSSLQQRPLQQKQQMKYYQEAHQKFYY